MPEFWITLLEQLKESKVALLILAGAGMFLVIGGLAALSHCYTLSGIKSRTVGDGQHGTARWATAKEIKKIYAHVPFRVRDWRSGHNRPAEQGLVLGCKGKKGELTALVDSDDIHCLMIGASGIGKTAYFLYPNLEYACASGMSWRWTARATLPGITEPSPRSAMGTISLLSTCVIPPARMATIC